MRNRRVFSGQSLVEFVLIFPIVLFLLLGFFDLGRAIFYYSSISNSVREGTRYAIVHKEVIDNVAKNNGYYALKQIVVDYSYGISGTDLVVDVVVKMDDADSTTRDKISITATYLYVPITPGIKQILGSETGITLEAHSSMLIEPISRND